MDFLEGLNPQQREAVAHTEGPLLILAGAGSGKTRVITHRIAHIVTSKRVPPASILAVTFTNKAAEEMRTRVSSLLSGYEVSSAPRVSTFHSFCVRLLRRDGDPLASIRPGFTRQFTIYDDEDQLVIVKGAFRRMGLDEKEFMQHRAALSRISHAKNQKKTPQDLYDAAADPVTEKLAVIFEEYEKELRRANALDFDDLLLEAVRLLYHDQATRESYNRWLSYVMIDEYQDTNRSQYELMRLLSQRHNNVCVVGDEDQSIYSWRGADIRNILDFERDFPNAHTIRLEENYRSTKNILAAAGAVVANNKARKGKTLWTRSDAGEMIGLYTAFDGENEALFIADTIERLLSADRRLRVAILYRTNFQSRQIEEALRRYGRKYIVVGGFSFYQRAEIKDALSYLKAALSPQDSVSLLRIINTPARGIGRTSVEQIEKYAREAGISMWDAIRRMLDEGVFPTRAQSALQVFRTMMEEMIECVATQRVDKALEFIIDRSGYRQMLNNDDSPEAVNRLENLNELTNAAAEAAERGENASDFLDHAALVSEADAINENVQVTLMTMHNAKGLEFPVVFIAGMEESLFPHSRSLDSEAGMEEERRLCYVGMTRAEKRLILTWARYRRRYGGGEQERTVASRFLSEVPERLILNLGPDEDSRIPQVDLHSERHAVRQSVQRNTFTGKTYNSLENISQFFNERGIAFPKPPPAPSAPAQSAPRQGAQPQAGPGQSAPRQTVPPQTAPVARKVLQTPPVATPKKVRAGQTVKHPKYGTGVVVRREGEGDDAKITVSFPRYGLKKLIERFAGLT